MIAEEQSELDLAEELGLQDHPGGLTAREQARAILWFGRRKQSLFAGSTEPAESYRSLDADARTLTEEWQQSVRERFARRSGAELRCVSSTRSTPPSS